MVLRGETMKGLKKAMGGSAEMAMVISDAIVHCHMRTMDRLGVDV